jgi:two-component system nitrate/nitrite response regulator NarL
LFAEALRTTLEAHGMDVVGLATTGRDALESLGELDPELVLVDIGLPDINGLEVGKEILARHPGALVLAVTAMNDPDAVGDALRLGFHGYITKDTPLPQFVKAIESAIEGQVVIPRRFSQRAAGGMSPSEQSAALLLKHLTARESQVLELLAKGASSTEIAAELSVSANTVRSHVQNILTKLQVHSRLEAAAFAVRHGAVKVRT